MTLQQLARELRDQPRLLAILLRSMGNEDIAKLSFIIGDDASEKLDTVKQKCEENPHRIYWERSLPSREALDELLKRKHFMSDVDQADLRQIVAFVRPRLRK